MTTYASVNPTSTNPTAGVPNVFRDDGATYYVADNAGSLIAVDAIVALHPAYTVAGAATALPLETGIYMLALKDFSAIGIFAVYNDGAGALSTVELVDTGTKFSHTKATASMVNFYFDATTKVLSIENKNAATQRVRIYRLA